MHVPPELSPSRKRLGKMQQRSPPTQPALVSARRAGIPSGASYIPTYIPRLFRLVIGTAVGTEVRMARSGRAPLVDVNRKELELRRTELPAEGHHQVVAQHHVHFDKGQHSALAQIDRLGVREGA